MTFLMLNHVKVSEEISSNWWVEVVTIMFVLVASETVLSSNRATVFSRI